CLQRSNWPQTF
nr:immunoglobulin light chain junction region [Macaca mulatta]